MTRVDLSKVDGPQMIRELQALVGIAETVEQSERGWAAMEDWEKESTCSAYSVLIGTIPLLTGAGG